MSALADAVRAEIERNGPTKVLVLGCRSMGDTTTVRARELGMFGPRNIVEPGTLAVRPGTTLVGPGTVRFWPLSSTEWDDAFLHAQSNMLTAPTDFYAVARGPLPSDDPTQRSLEEAVARRQASNARTEALRSDWHGADGFVAGANAGKLDHVMGRKP